MRQGQRQRRARSIFSTIEREIDAYTNDSPSCYGQWRKTKEECHKCPWQRECIKVDTEEY